MITQNNETFAEIGTPINPFPGLRPFEFDESHLFFGRDGQSEQLISKLSRTRFLAVVGTSGSGKSSLVRAGLRPSLIGGFMTSAGSGWRIAIMRPGNDPIGNLARALNAPDVFGSEIEENAAIQAAVAEAALRRGNRGLVDAVRQASMPENENLLVVVDQFEEIFRFAGVAQVEEFQNEAAAFVKLILEASGQREVPTYVVLTMRSDYLGDCSQFWDLPEAINESQYLIPRLTRDQLREAINGPVAVGSGKITPRLVNRLLNDVGDDQDQLPVLQHLLMRAWDEWRDLRLTVEVKDGDRTITMPHKEVHQAEGMDLCCYEAVGGMVEALSRHADEAFNELPDDRSREVAEKLFKCLTEKGTDNREIRRPIAMGEICAVADATAAEVTTVIEAFRHPRKSFLMPPAGVELKTESSIDISHESLIRGWERLRNWVEEEARSARTYQRLAATAALYRKHEEGLLRDPGLQLALDWLEQNKPNQPWARRYDPDFQGATTFLEESLAARDSEAQQKLERRRKEIKRARSMAIVFGILFLLALGGAWVAYRNGTEASGALKAAEASGKHVRQLNYDSNIGLAERAFDQGDRARGYELLQSFLSDKATSASDDLRDFAWYHLWRFNHDESSTLKGHLEFVYAVAFSPDGKTLASASRDGSVKLWDASTKQESSPLKGHLEPVYAVAFSPDGKTLASASRDGTVKLWDTSTKQDLNTPKRHLKPVYAVAFSPDGKRLASASLDGTVRLWDVSKTGELGTLTGHGGSVTSVTFSPDGKTLASASEDRTVKLWDVSTKEVLDTPMGTLKGHRDPVYAVAFSSDGKTLASASRDGTVKLWDVNTKKELSILKAQAEHVSPVPLSPDGKTLAGASEDSTVKLRDVNPKKELSRLKGQAEPVSPVPFSLDGKKLAGANKDSTLKLWDVSTKHEVSRSKGPGRSVYAVAFSPDGKTLASANEDSTLRLWDVNTRQELSTLKGHAEPVSAVAFSPDGKTLISGSYDNTAKLWDVSTKQASTLKGHGGSVTAVAFSPDGKTLASASEDSTVKLWDVSTKQELSMLIGCVAFYAVAFSPDGRTLASASWDHTVKLWDVNTKQELSRLEGHRDRVTGVAFSPDGRTLASASWDNTVKLWDVNTKQELSTLRGHGDSVTAVAFSPDGKTLASASWDHTVKLWDLSTKRELITLKGHGSAVTLVVFSRDGKTLASASEDRAVKLWDVSTKELSTLEGHAEPVSGVAFSPDGKTLASASGESTLKLWDVSTKQELSTVKGLRGSVISVAFSPDGKTLATGSGDGTIRLSLAATNEEVAAQRNK